jgi:diaminopimelate epimerase
VAGARRARVSLAPFRSLNEDRATLLRFAKYQGLGNDFIVVNGLNGPPTLGPARARKLCDRHFGVGADQLLALTAEPDADARMQVYNADGSEAGQCGNGLRCVARFLYDEGLVAESRSEVVIAVGRQRYHVLRLSASRYRVNMGRPAFTDVELPAELSEHGEAQLEALGRSFAAHCVHVGNPHAVIFSDGEPRPLAERYGPALERHPGFVARVNVSFVRPVERGFEAVVFERGDGITLACGSGATAIGAAAVAHGLWPKQEPMEIRLPGGTLQVTVRESGEVDMEGEAVRVFTGEVDLW